MQDSGEWRRAGRQTLLTRSSLHTALEPNLHRPDRAQGWRLAASEIEEAVIKILADALTSPAKLAEPFGAAGMPSDHIPKLLNRAARLTAALGGSRDERAKLVRELVEKIIVNEKTI